MSVSLTIKSNAAQFDAKLKKLVTKQFLFAAAVATTKTAVVVRNDYIAPEYKADVQDAKQRLHQGRPPRPRCQCDVYQADRRCRCLHPSS